MRRDALRTTQTHDGSKVAVWQLIGSSARILRLQLLGQSFTAYRLPSHTMLSGTQLGTIMFDAYPDLADARDMLPQHDDLWDALRDGYWAALLSRADLPDPLEP